MFGIILSCFVIMVGLILMPVIKEVVDDWFLESKVTKDKIWKFPENKITKDEIWKMKVEHDIWELNGKLKELEEKIDAINKRIDLVEENYKVQEFHTRYKIR